MCNGTSFGTMMQSRFAVSFIFFFFLLEFMLEVLDEKIGRFNVWN